MMNLSLDCQQASVLWTLVQGLVDPFLGLIELLLSEQGNGQVGVGQGIVGYETQKLTERGFGADWGFVLELGNTLIAQLDRSLRGWGSE